MRKLVKVIILGVLVAMSFGQASANDQNADLSWTAPETRENGDPIQPGDLAAYWLYWWIDATEFTREPQQYDRELGGEQTEETVVLSLPPRLAPYAVTFALRAVDSFGLYSRLSETLTVSVQVNPAADPAPPTGIRITITGGAISIIQ